MKLEAVTVCVNYADFLAETLPLNKPLFDRIVVVTTPEDKATQRVCEYWHVECVQTRAFGIEHGRFQKAAGINVGLRALSQDGWVVHLDADVVLPPLTRRIIENADLDKRQLYGADRHNIVGYKAWRKHVRRPQLQQEAGIYVHADRYRVATRFAPMDRGGYIPIGFFQLWNPRGSGVRTYPDGPKANAGSSDMLFAAQWPRSRRALIPEVIPYHLESERARQGANWSGRKTRPFAHQHHLPHPRARHALPAAAGSSTAYLALILLGWVVPALIALVLTLVFLFVLLWAHRPHPHPYVEANHKEPTP